MAKKNVIRNESLQDIADVYKQIKHEAPGDEGMRETRQRPGAKDCALRDRFDQRFEGPSDDVGREPGWCVMENDTLQALNCP